jgi:hypothetical protein
MNSLTHFGKPLGSPFREAAGFGDCTLTISFECENKQSNERKYETQAADEELEGRMAH